MTLIAKDAADRAEQLLTLTRRLTDLVERETALYTARRPLEAAPFRDEKAKLANAYRHETQRIAREPSLIADAPAPLRASLTAATTEFRGALERHAAAVSALQELTEGLVRAIAQHIADVRDVGAGYGPGAKTARATPAAVALNRTA
jgi:hypothetical protein